MFKQLSLFPEPEEIKKPWWIGLPCAEMFYFDLMMRGCDPDDIMKVWDIDDYRRDHMKDEEEKLLNK